MTSRRERITEQRRQKLDRIRSNGIDPYPHRYQRTHTAQQAIEQLQKLEAQPDPEKVLAELEGKKLEDTVSVAGRIMSQRKMGKSAFVDIRDGSGKIQLLFQNINKYDQGQTKLFDNLDIGDFIGVEGKLLRTKTGEPTVSVGDFDLLAKSLRPLPEKWHGLSDVDTRYRQRYLDLISNPEVKETFKIRSQVIAAIRHFLNQQGFIEVETPVLQPSAGGALARPFVTHHHALDQDFYLRIATELHLKRLIVGGLDKVYEIGRIFRNEGIDTRHNPEFTLLESYEAYADYHDVMKMVEAMVFKISQQVLDSDQVKYGDSIINLKPPWRRVSLREVIIEYSGIDFDKYPDTDKLREKMRSVNIEVDTEKNWAKLIDELLSTFVKPNLIQPTFVLDYPVDMSPLAKKKPGNDRLVERFQAFAGGMELGNAYSELNDPIEQRERFEEQLQERQGDDKEKWTIDEDFLLALEYGMPPTGGLGVGVDRLVMLLTNQQSIREVILFPQLRDKPYVKEAVYIDSRDVEKITKYCDQVLDLNNARLSDNEYSYQSLSLCVIDAVYSIGVRYEAVRRVVHRYCNYFNLRRIRENRSNIPPKETQESIADFWKKIYDSGIEKFATEVFCNRQRTSTRNGILKSEAVFKFATVLKKYDVNYLQDVPKIVSDTNFEKEIKSIPGQTTGTSLKYFFMLSGDDDFIKPDRMILRFLEDALQRPVNRNEASSFLDETTRRLQSKYSHLVPRLLDHEIWVYQRRKLALRKQSKY